MQRNFDPADPYALLTLQGSAGSALLAALFAHPAPSASVSELAAASKVATATAARTVQRLVEAGLVIDERAGRERLLRWNPDSAYARPIQDLLWISHGAIYDPPEDRPWMARPRGWGRLQVADVDVAALIPRCLHARSNGTQPPSSVEPDVLGPLALQVRAQVLELERLSVRLGSQWLLQEAYQRWHVEHDRDMIHLVLHQGAGLHQAISVLREATREQPSSATISPSVWAHALYAVSAEATMATTIAQRALILVDDAINEQSTDRDLLGAAREVLWRERDRAGSGESGPELRPALMAATAPAPVAVLRARADPGAGFERVLLVQCEAIAEAMSARVAAMSAHPSFAAWLRVNPADPEHPHPVPVS